MVASDGKKNKYKHIFFSTVKNKQTTQHMFVCLCCRIIIKDTLKDLRHLK